MKVRSGYTEQLRNLDLVATNFIPLILNILNLWTGAGKAFKLDIWSIDEFYLPCEKLYGTYLATLLIIAA